MLCCSYMCHPDEGAPKAIQPYWVNRGNAESQEQYRCADCTPFHPCRSLCRRGSCLNTPVCRVRQCRCSVRYRFQENKVWSISPLESSTQLWSYPLPFLSCTNSKLSICSPTERGVVKSMGVPSTGRISPVVI